jgi:hypothetical protein
MKFEQYAGQETTAGAIWLHIHSKGLKVINLALGSVAVMFFEDIYKRFNIVNRYGLVYGEDYVITPYVAGEETAIAAFAKDTWGTVSTDIYGTPIPDLPLMQRVRTLDDVALAFMTSYSYTSYDYFIRQWGYAYNKPLIQALHAFSPIAYAYPFPVTGCLDGDKGNAEYEFMTHNPGDAIARYDATNTQSGAYLIMLFGGMIMYLWGRNRDKGKERAQTGAAKSEPERSHYGGMER